MILLRQLASYLTIPIWMMDEKGSLIYYNEPAENLLGISFDDVGPIEADQLTEMFRATDLEDRPIENSDFPVVSTLVSRRPSHGTIRFCGLDRIWREVEISAIPVEGQGDRFLGVFAAFWETSD